MQYVFVVDTNKQPQTPVHPAVARRLLSSGQAAVWRQYPFTLILKAVGLGPLFTQPCRLKIDPGSKATGIAVLHGAAVLWAAELTHRGQRITAALDARRAVRRNRRQRKTRYRAPRFLNRARPKGWLPPSLQSRVANITTWVARLQRLCPIGAVSQELVRFDTQLMQNAEISGDEYQRGTLYGYERREYLLEKWHRTCAYCGTQQVPLEEEHIIPRSRGGSDRVSNLTLACVPCNQAKNNKTAAEFGFPHIQTQAKVPLKDAAAVNITRWALYHALQTTGLPVEIGTGGRTKYNRTRQHLPKTHWLDAACVGASTPERLRLRGITPLQITAVGHGTRQMCGTNAAGVPIRHRTRQKRYRGWQTGDLVRAVIPIGKYAGVHVGRVAIRQRPAFKIGRIQVHPKSLTRLQRSDGYAYSLPANTGIVVSSLPRKRGASTTALLGEESYE